MQDHTESTCDVAPRKAPAPAWLTELRPLEVCAVAAALGFIAYRCFFG
jgi:hypothetical protein